MSGSFPQRLVDVMSRDTLGAIVFNRDRNGLIINLPLFDRLYLLTGHFRTRRLPSFIRQLNLYGFKQVNHADKKSQVKEYRHVFLTFSNHLELEWLTRISAAKADKTGIGLSAVALMSHPSTGIKSTPTEVRLQHNYLQPVLKELKMPSEMLSQSPITSPISHGRKIHVKKTWVPPTKAQLSLEESEDEEWNEYLRQLTSK